jgi:DNA invertase Pin-like site-specific DNA recombinase
MRDAAIYLRSRQANILRSAPEDIIDQEQELREVANRIGCQIIKVYRDEWSSTTKRPQLDRLRSDALNRKFDFVIAWSVEGLARSLKELLRLFSEMNSLKIDLYVHLQKIDTTTPTGKAMLAVTDVFAALERAIAVERLQAGRATVKQDGVKLGRPKKIDPSVESAIRDALRKGDAGIIRIAQRFGVGTGTVQRIKAEMAS